MRVAVVSHNARQFDAIGNNIADKVAFFLDRQAEARVFVETDQALHADLHDHCQLIDDNEAITYLESCDLVFFEFGQGYSTLSWLPYMAGKKPRLIIDYHCVTPPAMWSGRHRREMERAGRMRKLAWCVDAVWVHSQYAQRELQAATGLPDDRIHCIGFPVDSADQHGDSTPSYTNDRHTILFVGRLAPNKRVPVLIEALAELRDRTPPVHAVVIGDAGDVYEDEKAECLQLAQALEVADRIEFRGQVTGDELRKAYRSADVFVMPSLHEGFCIPVVEAMANRVPVIAARAAALPETVGDTGLTFAPDDAHDLAVQIHRVLDSKVCRPPSSDKKRVAVVTCRFGDRIVGGAETSLRSMASALQKDGHSVEVLTTCTSSDNDWRNDLPTGRCNVQGLSVRRFPIDQHDRATHLESVAKIKRHDGAVPVELAEAYLERSLHSSDLVEHLAERIQDFDAVFVGPYLFGLTADVVRAFPSKTIVAPCFHDEPFAYLPVWPRLFGNAGGILFHSQSEMRFAQAILGVNHPNSHVAGAVLEFTDGVSPVDPTLCTTPYLVYCGRYSPEKDLPRLIDFAREYNDRWPGRFRMVFMGQGSVAIPDEPWAVDLGFVSQQRKRQVLAHATALVQLSRNESLSLVALEAWREATPVIADRRCAVLADFIRDSGGGATIENFDEFSKLLNSIWSNPNIWTTRGNQGREFVKARFGDPRRYVETLTTAIDELTEPIADNMKRRGLVRASAFSHGAWEARLASLTEVVLERETRLVRHNVVIEPQRTEIAGAVGQSMLISVRIENQGTHCLMGEGPAAAYIEANCDGVALSSQPLPGILAPGESTVVTLPLTLPSTPGPRDVSVQIVQGQFKIPEPASIAITVSSNADPSNDEFCRPFLDDIDAALVELHRNQELPTGYTDVSGGWLANWKRRIKQKLLNNFKQAYVDVLSRQQSEFNQQSMIAMQRMAECCESLQNTVAALDQRVRALEGNGKRTAENAERRREEISAR